MVKYENLNGARAHEKVWRRLKARHYESEVNDHICYAQGASEYDRRER